MALTPRAITMLRTLSHMRVLQLLVSLCVAVSVSLVAAPDQSATFLPVDEIRPGMEGVGRTVFAGDQIEEFKVHILGVLKNVTAPQHDLILARLEGGPLERTGVIQGMSGSPVYVNGRLIGAVSYALGSFPKEPLAGITPISEMINAATLPASRRVASDLALTWPAAPAQVFAALGRLSSRAVMGGAAPSALRVVGPSSLADLAPSLRPIGAAMVFGGFDQEFSSELRRSMNAGGGAQAPGRANGDGDNAGPLRPGDPVGMALMRGDLEMGATGTVTHVEGGRVYAFGHPFLNMGPTTMPMTRARVMTVLPSLDSSMKIATLGPMIGTVSQDRSTGIAGTMGDGPAELDVTVTLKSDRAADRRMEFKVLHDQTLTPLFAYVAVLNALAGFERQSGVLTVETSGEVSFGSAGTVTIDDVFSGETAASAAAAAATAAIGMAATNEFRPALAERLSVTLRVREVQEYTTIERVWLDTVRPRSGATQTLNVMLRDYRGATQTVTMPVTLPAAAGAVTLLVTDAAGLSALEDRELRPGKPSNWSALLTKMNGVRRNNMIYVRMLSSSAGTVVAGDTLPALPASVRSVFDEDKTVATAPVAKSVVGSWEQRMNRMVRGSRELTLNVTSR